MKMSLADFVICDHCGIENKKGVKNCTNCGRPLTRDHYKHLWLRNTLITLGLFLLPFVILFYIVSFEVSTSFEKQIQNSLEYSVEVNVRTIMSFLDEREKDLLSIAKSDIENLSDIRLRRQFYKTFIKEKPWFEFIAVVNPKGDIIFSTNDIKGNMKGREYFNQSVAGSFFNSGIFHSEILDTTAMLISAPFYNRDNKIAGVIVAAISLSEFYNLILDLRIGKTSEVFLVDDQGIFLSPSKLGGNVLRESGFNKGDKNPHHGAGGILTHRDYRGEMVLCAFRKFITPNWYLVSEMDVKEAMTPVIALKRGMFFTFIIFGSFLILLSLFFSRQVINTLKSLTASLKQAYDDISQKKDTINKINVELRKRLKECEALSEELRVSEDYIKNIINSISSGLVAFNENLKITYFNEYVRNFAVDGRIEIQDDVINVLPIFNDIVIKEGIVDIFKKNEPFRIDKRSITIDSRNITVAITAFPLREADRVHGVILLINDITEQQRLQNQMADYEKLSALSQLALGAAHEINNPLLGITSYIEILLEEEKDVEKKTRAKEVLDSAYRISETVRGLLNFARPTPPKFIKINLNKLVTETISFLRHQPLFKKLKIERLLSAELPEITADINQMRQVLINIFINAAQAMPGSGILTVSTNKVKFEDHIEIIIKDTGIGMSPENTKKAFEPFFTTKKGEGTGLGLSISYSYIKNHNGDISITSELNKGTMVKILLPIRQGVKIHSEVIE